MSPVHPNYLLALWVQFHGEVAYRYQSVFLERPEIQELVHYPMQTLREAFASSPRLKEIVEKARELSPGVRETSRPGYTPNPPKKMAYLPPGVDAHRLIAQKYKWWD